MIFTSSLTLYLVIKAVLQHLYTRTIVDPSFKDAAVPYNNLDLSNNRLDAIEDLSKALEKEKRTFIKRIVLCYLEIKVKDL
jgi:O-phosphoseryl-tRNA(Cys) synthetase